MAFSQSVKRGQAPATCNLCEEETKIKWKCLNCNMLMCTRCKDKIHVKFKFAKDHKVIDIKSVGEYLDELDFSDLKCEEHSGQSAVMFCSTCDNLVCTSCISKFHNGHGLVELSEGYNITMEKLIDEHKKAKAKIDKLTKDKEAMGQVNMKDSTQYNDLLQKITAQNNEIKKSADNYTEEMKCQLTIKWRGLQEEKVGNVEKVVNNLQELSSNAEDVIQAKDAEKLFFQCKKMSMAVNRIETDLNTISFLPGQMSPYVFGSLQVVSSTVDVRIVKTFQPDIPRVGYQSLCPDNSLWISDADDVLQRVKPVEHKLTIESTLNIQIFGMAVTPTGDLLLAVGVPVLKQISGKTGKLTDSIYSMYPLNPTSVYVTKDGKVIVGGLGGETTFPASGRRPVIVMNQKGENETVYEFDKNNMRMFTLPVNITSTFNGNLCVVDKLSADGRGRVVVLSHEGIVLQIYTGHPDTNNKMNIFKPVKIVTSPSDNLIVTELNISIFHILNNCGHLITCYNVNDIGIKRAFVLSFTNTAGQLYIGCNNSSVKSSDKGKLYEVQISGC